MLFISYIFFLYYVQAFKFGKRKILLSAISKLKMVAESDFSMANCIMSSRDLIDIKSGLPIKTIGMPRIIAGNQATPGQPWLLWYHYRDDSITKNTINISSGKIASAVSLDGLHNWQNRENSPVLIPSKLNGDWFYFDSEHVGLGDVIQAGSNLQSQFNIDSNVFLMYTFGGTNQAIQTTESSEPMIGSKMEIGVAVSQDGINWSRVEGPSAYGSIIEVGKAADAFDKEFVGWPSVIEYQREYRMYYHTYDRDLKRFIIGLAIAKDGLLTWRKYGPVFSGSNEPGAFDEGGASRRHVIKLDSGEFRMYYEAVSSSGKHSIGLAKSKDGFIWERVSNTPVFETSSDPMAWDAGSVSSPHLVWIPSKKVWRMYYVGYPMTINDQKNEWNGIGVAESTDEFGTSFVRVNIH